jgi:hypothetical protein
VARYHCDVELGDGDLLVTRLQAPILWNIFKYGGVRMIGWHIYGRRIEQQSFGQTALMLGDDGEALEFFGVDDREIEAGLGGVAEKDGVDDFAGGGGQAEGDVGDAEDGFDVRDLLFDETDG